MPLSPQQAVFVAVTLGGKRRHISRSDLEKLLWDRRGEASFRHRASQLVYACNQKLEASVFRFRGELLVVNRGLVESDLDRFRASISNHRYDDAADLLDAKFLSRLKHPTGDALLDWISMRRRALRARLTGRLLSAVSEGEAGRGWRRAHLAGEVLLRLNPMDESILRKAMRAQARVGRVREAESAYREFFERTAGEGRWEPQRATARLLKALRGVRRRTRMGPPPRRNEAPTLRGALLSKTASHLAQKEPGTLRVALVTGERGSGKSRFAIESMARLRAQGRRVAWARGPSLVAGLKEMQIPPGGDFGGFAPAAGTDPAPNAAILVLDDAELTSKTGIRLLKRLCAPRDGPGGGSAHPTPGLLLAFTPSKARRNAKLGQFLEWLRRRAFLAESALDPLSPSQAETLLRARGSARAPRSESSLLLAWSGANPRAFSEIASSPESLSWRPARLGPNGLSVELAQLPDSLAEFLFHWISDASDVERGVLETLAIATAPLLIWPSLESRSATPSATVLAEATGLGLGEALARLEALGRHGLVRWRAGRPFPRGTLLHAALLARLEKGRQATLHNLLTRALARRAFGANSLGEDPTRSVEPGRDPLPGVDPLAIGLIAFHAAEAGRRSLARLCAHRARELSRPRDAWVERMALDVIGSVERGHRRRRLLVPLASVNDRLGRSTIALDEAREASCGAADLSAAQWLAVQRIESRSRWLLALDDPNRTRRRLCSLEAEAIRLGHEGELARILDCRLELCGALGATEEARGILARVERLPEGGGLAPMLAWTILANASAFGRTKLALGAARRAAEVPRGRSPERLRVFERYTSALSAAGLLAGEEGRRALAVTTQLCLDAGEHHRLASVLCRVANWHASAGNRDNGIALLREAGRVRRDGTRRFGDTEGLGFHLDFAELAARGYMALLDRDFGGARLAFEKARNRAEPSVPRCLLTSLAANEGRGLLGLGKLAGANQLATRYPFRDGDASQPVSVALFHAQLLSRRGRTKAALALLDRQIAAEKRPVPRLRASWHWVLLARRSGRNPLARAAAAREEAEALHLMEMAGRFRAIMRWPAS